MQDLLNLKTTSEVATEVGKSVATISRYVKAGRISPVIKGDGLRGQMWFTPSDVRRLKAELEARAVTA